MSQKLSLYVLVLATLTVLNSRQQAEATTVLRMTVAEQIDQADLIFTGVATATQIALSAKRRIPYTFVTFKVEEILKGSIDTPELTLRFLGGETDTGAMIVAGMPTFTLGESYLLFIKGNGMRDCPLLGWEQGKLSFAFDPTSGKEILTNNSGAPLSGIANGSWISASPLEKSGSDINQLGSRTIKSSSAPMPELVQDLDVAAPSQPSITTAAEAVEPTHVVESAKVLQSLRSLIHERATAAQSLALGMDSTQRAYVEGSMVRSADFLNLPELDDIKPVAPFQQ